MSLAARYAALDARTAELSRASGIACPPGCGQCCESIHAPISRPEADALAAFLVEHPRALAHYEARAGSLPDGTCPMYDPHDPAHCTVYEARPLVCRAFGFHAMRAKSGAPEYVPCRRFHETPQGAERVRAAQSRAATLPILSDETLALDPAGESLPIALAVASALDALRLRRSLST
jgi:Fe-S-cluster containining protein